MKKIKSLLLYGGLDRETYRRIRLRINEENRKSVTVFTIVGAVSFLISAVLSIINSMDMPNRVYFVGAGFFLAMLLFNELLHKKMPLISDAFAILFSVALLSAGVLIAYNQPGERTTMLLPLFTLVSLVFCYRPIYLFSVLTCVELFYLVLMSTVQSEELFFINFVNTVIFYFVGMVCGVYTLIIKHKKYKAENENQTLLERDVLTGLYNRYSCHLAFEKILSEQTPVTVCSLDVNGLKQLNDAKGHLAGDELIKGAADCILKVFKPYGNVYRIGGDEFCAILYRDFDEKALREEFSDKLKAYKGILVDEVSVALGMARLESGYTNDDFLSVIHAADLQMYEEKKVYHTTHDRRKTGAVSAVGGQE